MAVWKLEILYLIIGAAAEAKLRYKIGGDQLYAYGIPVTIPFINVRGGFNFGSMMTTVQKFGLNQEIRNPPWYGILRFVHDNVFIRS